MYSPEFAREKDEARLLAFMKQYSFGTLISGGNGRAMATALPFVVYGTLPSNLILRGHISRENRQWEFMQEGTEVLALFQGPHGYISPSWYSHPGNVPTWNYVSVQAGGKIQYLNDEVSITNFLLDLWSAYEEGAEESYRNVPERYLSNLLKDIVCFEIHITSLEGVFKLSQNKPEKDRLNIIRMLEQSAKPDNHNLASLMREEEDR